MCNCSAAAICVDAVCTLAVTIFQWTGVVEWLLRCPMMLSLAPQRARSLGNFQNVRVHRHCHQASGLVSSCSCSAPWMFLPGEGWANTADTLCAWSCGLRCLQYWWQLLACCRPWTALHDTHASLLLCYAVMGDKHCVLCCWRQAKARTATALGLFAGC